ncbi:MAG TPA: cyclic nucleotide-binding domain-containing protein [Thermoleophilaceae bacterium]
MTDQPAVELPDHVLDFLSEQGTMTLATASPAGVPRATTLLYVNDGPTLYFWSKPNTTTAKHIERNPIVSFAIDSYTDDLRQTKGVQGMAEARVILSGEEIARVAALFGDKFPDLSPGATMSISFFRVAPTDIEFIDNTDSGSETQGETFGAEFHRQRAYSVFTDLPVENIDTIGAALQQMEVGEGDVVVREGGPADKFFIVVEGELEVSREEGARERVGPGGFYGEVSILTDTPRVATVTATKPSKLLTMERDTFKELVAQALGTTAEFERVIQDRLAASGR